MDGMTDAAQLDPAHFVRSTLVRRHLARVADAHRDPTTGLVNANTLAARVADDFELAGEGRAVLEALHGVVVAFAEVLNAS